MDYLVDTVALVRHLRGKGKIGNRARQILREADGGLRSKLLSEANRTAYHCYFCRHADGNPLSKRKS